MFHLLHASICLLAGLPWLKRRLFYYFCKNPAIWVVINILGARCRPMTQWLVKCVLEVNGKPQLSFIAAQKLLSPKSVINERSMQVGMVDYRKYCRTQTMLFRLSSLFTGGRTRHRIHYDALHMLARSGQDNWILWILFSSTQWTLLTGNFYKC